MSTCGAFTGAELTHPFGDDTAVFKVTGRIFAVTSLHEEPSSVTLKCDPDYAALLVQQFGEVVPGYHMNKHHWITITLSATMSADLVDELIGVSYDLVVAGLSAPARSALGPASIDDPHLPRRD